MIYFCQPFSTLTKTISEFLGSDCTFGWLFCTLVVSLWSFQEKPKSFPAKPKFWRGNTIKHKITSGTIVEISFKITC